MIIYNIKTTGIISRYNTYLCYETIIIIILNKLKLNIKNAWNLEKVTISLGYKF